MASLEPYKEALRSFFEEAGDVVILSSQSMARYPKWPEFWVSPYGWKDYKATLHIHNKCSVVIPEGVTVTETSYSVFQDTFTGNKDEIGLNVYGGSKDSETNIHCACGKYSGLMLRITSSLGDIIKRLNGPDQPMHL